jgi:uncharacterized protein YciI
MNLSPVHAVLRQAGMACLALCLSGAAAQTAPAAPAASAAQASAEPVLLLFAIEIKTGPAWDNSRAPQDQAHFREHSLHLRRLREQGVLVMGARYADKGLVVMRAANESEAHALLKGDPSIQAGVFQYELHEFRVFYGGTLAAPIRPR